MTSALSGVFRASLAALLFAAAFSNAFAQSLSAEEMRMENGLEVVRLQSDGFERAGLSMQWDFRPALQLERAGVGEALSRCLSAAWAADTLGKGYGLEWSVTETGFIAEGNADSQEEWGLMLLNDLIDGDADAEWERVQREWLNQWDVQYLDPDRIVERARTWSVFSARHPLGELTQACTIETISRSDVQAFEAAYWHPNNARLAWATSREAAGLPESWTNTLLAWPSREVQKAAIPLPSRPRNMVATVVPVEGESVHWALAHGVRLKPDHPDALATSLLVQHIRRTTGEDLRLDLRSIASELHVQWDNTAAATPLTTVRDAMAQATREAPDDSTLYHMRAASLKGWSSQLTTPALALEFAASSPVIFQAAAKGTLEAELNEITPQDIQRVAINYLRPNNMHVIAVGDAAEAQAHLQAMVNEEDIVYCDAYVRPVSRFGPPPAGLTAEDVIRGHYDACGGTEQFLALRSCQQTGTMKAGGGMVMHVDAEELYGVGHRTSISVEGQVMMEQLVRPGEGISYQMGKRRPMPSDEFHRFEPGLFPAPLLAWKERGLSVELVGTRAIGGKEEWVVECKRDGAIAELLFFDSASKRLVRRTEERNGPTGPVRVVTTFENYREFEGLSHATVITRESNNQSMVFTIESLLPNARVDKKQFEWE